MCWDLSEMRWYFLRLMDLPHYGVSWLWYLTMPQWQPFGVADFWYSYCCKMYESKPPSEKSTFTLGYLGQFNSESAIHKLCLWPLQYHNNEYYLKGDACLRKIKKCNECTCISALCSNHVKLKHKNLEKSIALGLIRIVLCIYMYINFTSKPILQCMTNAKYLFININFAKLYVQTCVQWRWNCLQSAEASSSCAWRQSSNYL